MMYLFFIDSLIFCIKANIISKPTTRSNYNYNMSEAGIVVTLAAPNYDLESHLRLISVFFFTESSEYYSNKAAIDGFITELCEQLPTMFKEVEENFPTQGDKRRAEEQPMSSLWTKYAEFARLRAKQLKMVVNKTCAAITCYLAAITLLLWLLRVDRNDLTFNSNEDFLAQFSSYQNYDPAEITLYRYAANMMQTVFFLLKPSSNKTWVLQYLMSRLLLSRSHKYKPGGGSKSSNTGQNREFCDLCSIYEKLGGVVPTEWSKKRRSLRRYSKGGSTIESASSDGEGDDHDGDSYGDTYDSSSPCATRKRSRRQRTQTVKVSPGSSNGYGYSDSAAYAAATAAASRDTEDLGLELGFDDIEDEFIGNQQQHPLQLKLPPIDRVQRYKPIQISPDLNSTAPPAPPLRDISALSSIGPLSSYPPVYRSCTESSVTCHNDAQEQYVEPDQQESHPNQVALSDSQQTKQMQQCFPGEQTQQAPHVQQSRESFSSSPNNKRMRETEDEARTPTTVTSLHVDEEDRFRSVAVTPEIKNTETPEMTAIVAAVSKPVLPKAIHRVYPETQAEATAKAAAKAAAEDPSWNKQKALRQLGFDTYFRPYEEPYMKQFQSECGRSKLSSYITSNNSYLYLNDGSTGTISSESESTPTAEPATRRATAGSVGNDAESDSSSISGATQSATRTSDEQPPSID